MTNKIKIHTALYLALVTILGIGLSVSCSKSGFKSKSGGSGSASKVPNVISKDKDSSLDDEETSGTDTDKEVNDKKDETSAPLDKTKVNSVYAFKKMRSLNATYKLLTGVENNLQADPGDNNDNTKPAQTIGQVFDGLRAGLPKSGVVKNLSPTDISAVTKLAMGYCIALMSDETLAAQKFPGVNLAGPKAGLDNNAAADALMNAFWHMGMENAPDSVESKEILTTLFNDLKADQTVDTAGQLMIAGCSVALSSPIVALK